MLDDDGKWWMVTGAGVWVCSSRSNGTDVPPSAGWTDYQGKMKHPPPTLVIGGQRGGGDGWVVFNGHEYKYIAASKTFDEHERVLWRSTTTLRLA